MIGPFRRRSSWPSSFATGLIGWIGFAIIVPLALGYSGPLGEPFLAGLLAAFLQVALLRLTFFALKMDNAVWVGGVWGGIAGGLLVLGEMTLFDVVRQHPFLALATGIYVGLPVGAFLSYFYRDDRSIEAEAQASRKPIDYGRDAHWLDPFVYGAIAYEAALLPETSDVAISAAVVGMIVGVVAAGVSHFILSLWKNAPWTIAAAGAVGAAIGAPTGLLFRNYSQQLLLPPVLAGAAAGALTFLITGTVGRFLSLREERSAGEGGKA